MSAQIESYVAPDLSEFDKTIALTKEEMKSKTELNTNRSRNAYAVKWK
jgi:hypothetical protein